MSFNGSGTFVINSAGQPVVTGTTIASTAFNSLTADLATGLSTTLTKDGQSTPTANIPMGTFKITGLGNGTASTDAVNLGQVQGAFTGSGYTTTATAAGTTTLTVASNPNQYFTGATTQTVVLPVASTMTALGQQFRIVNLSSGTVTVNSSGGNLVASVVANTQVTITVILLSGTDALSWDVKFSGTTSTTGTGSAVRGTAPTLSNPTVSTGTFTSPTLVTPALGVATGTSIALGGGSALANYVTTTTFTPAIAFGAGTTGITYGTNGQTGQYLRIGQLVFVRIYIALTSKGSSSGVMTLTGLPLTSVTTLAGGESPLTMGYWSSIDLNSAGGLYAIGCVINSNSTVAVLNQIGDNAGPTQLTDANFANNSTFTVAGCYLTSAA